MEQTNGTLGNSALRMGGRPGRTLAAFFAGIAAHNMGANAGVLPGVYDRTVRTPGRRSRPRLNSNRADYLKGIAGYSKLAKKIAKGSVGMRRGA